MAFWKFKVKSDTVNVDSTGRASVNLDLLFKKDHVVKTLARMRKHAGSGDKIATETTHGQVLTHH
ncbi:MAG TPA: hypothetical protein VES20_22680 [Bryobacteraceae bacterium]|nr:hypothetical protein [Bryobacteraceae bacterium]